MLKTEWLTSPDTRRRWTRDAAVTCGVVTAHALFFAGLCLDLRPQTSTHSGAYGDIVTLSLVESVDPPGTEKAPPAVAKVQPAPTENPAEPAETAPDSLTPPPDEMAASADASPLSETDMAALAGFVMPASAGAPGEACNLTALLATGFATSPAVAQGLAGLPVDQRSVANAVMLWDGGWPDDTRTGGKALLRALLIKAVSSAPQPCLDQVQRGPVLFFVPDNGTTAVLAIGSGEWRWGDLIAPEPDGNYFLTLASVIPTTP